METTTINIGTTIPLVRDVIKNTRSGQLYLTNSPCKLLVIWDNTSIRVLHDNSASYFDNDIDALDTLKDIIESINNKVETSCNASDLQPLQPVLVRDDYLYKWELGLFGRVDDESNAEHPYICIGERYAQCIPYKGNEHLLGTRKSPKQNSNL